MSEVAHGCIAGCNLLHPYMQVHGSAPDIAGQDKANPMAMVLSAAMMCRYGLSLPKVCGHPASELLLCADSLVFCQKLQSLLL